MVEIKVTLHIPTEQYGFVAVECDGLSAEETARLYSEYAEAFRPKPIKSLLETARQLLEKDTTYNRFLDHMLLGEGNHADELEGANDMQKLVINEVKKAIKRVRGKE